MLCASLRAPSYCSRRKQGGACGVFQKNGTWSPRFAGDGRAEDPFFGEASLRWIEQTSSLMGKLTPGLGVIPNFAIYNGIRSFAWNSSEAKRVAASSSGILSERGVRGVQAYMIRFLRLIINTHFLHLSILRFYRLGIVWLTRSDR